MPWVLESLERHCLNWLRNMDHRLQNDIVNPSLLCLALVMSLMHADGKRTVLNNIDYIFIYLCLFGLKAI